MEFQGRQRIRSITKDMQNSLALSKVYGFDSCAFLLSFLIQLGSVWLPRKYRNRKKIRKIEDKFFHCSGPRKSNAAGRSSVLV